MTGPSPYAVLTPYLVPAGLAGKKVVNLGDGFILRAIERLVGRFDPACTFSPRLPLPAAATAVLAARPATILAGANQLATGWTLWPGLTADGLRASKVVPVPFGVGLHGAPGHSETLSTPTKELLLAVHERIRWSSWRCPDTVALLCRELPSLADRVLMTGCPVLYDEPLLAGAAFSREVTHVAVTPTERGDFFARDAAVVEFVARRWPRARRTLVLHQDFVPAARGERRRRRWWPFGAGPATAADAAAASVGVDVDDCLRLRRLAERSGFGIEAPTACDALIRFYRSVDLHVGTRLHAHLLCLSRATRSALIAVDGRARGIATAFDFPLAADAAGLDEAIGHDFERVRRRAREHVATMHRFVQSLPR